MYQAQGLAPLQNYRLSKTKQGTPETADDQFSSEAFIFMKTFSMDTAH
jgi:hypothetical protein